MQFKDQKSVVLGMVALALVIGGAFWYLSQNQSQNPMTTQPEPSPVAVEVPHQGGVIPDTGVPSTVEPVVPEPIPNPVVTTPTPVPAVPTPTTPTPTPVPVPVPTPTPVVPSTAYADGTYTAVGTYGTPEGSEKLGITLTIKNDVIVAASGENQARDKVSRKYVDTFLSSFAPLVIGKSLSDVSLGKVSGSSLTPKGFNDAVVKIRTQADV